MKGQGEKNKPGLEGGQNVVLIGIMDNNTTLLHVHQKLLILWYRTFYKYGIKNTNWEFVELEIKEEQ